MKPSKNSYTDVPSSIRSSFLLWVALSACGLGEIDPGSGIEENSDLAGLTPQVIRVATWNIETIGNPGTSEYNATVLVLKRINADVIGFNEIDASVDLNAFTRLAQDAGYPFTALAGPSPFGADRNGFFSKLPIVSQVAHTSAALSGDSSAQDMTRLPLEITVDVPNTSVDLTLLVQHWKSGFEDSDELRRAIESFRLRQALSSRSVQESAYVVMGDVNFERGDATFPSVFTSIPSGMPSSFDLGQDLQSKLSSGGLRNNPFADLEDSAGPSLTTLDRRQKDGSRATRPTSGRSIDHVLVSPVLAALSPLTEIYDSRDEGLSGGLPKAGNALSSGTSAQASDHLPILVDLKVPQGAPRPLWLSFKEGETLPDVGAVSNEDIVQLDPATGVFSLLFDGSDVGIASLGIDGLAALPSGELLLSFDGAGSVPGISGTVDDSDIVLFQPVSLGDTTQGDFALYFDGSDVGLSADDEDIDGLALTSQGDLLLSLLGTGSVSGLTPNDEDLIRFQASSLGDNTQGSFSLFFDGSNHELTTSGEDLDGVAFEASGELLFSTTGDVSARGFVGGDEDIFRLSSSTGSFQARAILTEFGVDLAADVGGLEIAP